jgi:hypothetical protein
MTMVASNENATPTDLAGFGERIERLRRDGPWDSERGERIPWAEATEALKLGAIVGEALSVSVRGPNVSGAETLAAVERNARMEGNVRTGEAAA